MNKLSPVLLYACQQSISAPPTGNQWSETLAISIHLFSEAFASGWYREQFGKDSKSFLVLLGIVMHARPLCGPDLALLIRLGLATPADEHRLYARITDSGLADEIGFHRDTVARCAQQLADRGLIHIGLLPDGYGFRDSRGSFAGTKLYLVAGEVEKCLHKQLHHRESAPASRAEKFGRPAENFRTNIESLKESVVVNGGDTAGDSLHQIFSAFALRKCLPSYSPTPKERAAADQLLADGFQLDSDILPGIARAFDDAPRPVRYFTYCAHVIRESRKRAAPAPRPGSSKPHTTDLPIPPELARAAALYARAAGQCGSDSLIRLGCMAQSCAGAAQAAGASGEDWLADALEEAIGRANPRHLLAYAGKILDNWRTNGRQPPPTRRLALSEQTLSPELEVFQQATGRLPLRDQVELVERTLRENNLINAAYLQVYWEEWVRRDKKRSDLTWLNWAVQGRIPDTHAPGSALEEMLHNLAVVAQQGADDGQP